MLLRNINVLKRRTFRKYWGNVRKEHHLLEKVEEGFFVVVLFKNPKKSS